MDQDIRFCTAADGTRVAWASTGHGPPVVKAAHWLTHLEHDLRSPVWAPWTAALAARHRLIRYDQRGCGLSDRSVRTFHLDALVQDLAAVVDAASLPSFALIGMSQGAAVAVRYAAEHPGRVSCLVLCGGFARGRSVRGDQREHPDQDALLQEAVRVGWGRPDPLFRRVFTSRLVPHSSEAQRRWFDELARVSTSPQTAAALRQAWADIEVTADLARITVPTLVAHARGDVMVPIEEGRLLAQQIAAARFLPLESANHVLLPGEQAYGEFLSAALALVDRHSSGAVERSTAALSVREREVLTLATGGASNEEIAAVLHLSSRTVERHLSNCYTKLGLSGRSARTAAAALLAAEGGAR